MNHKKLAKILWHGIDIPVPATDNHLEGLNPGEIYICDDDADPSIYILTAAGNVKKISGAAGNMQEAMKAFIKVLVPVDETGNVVFLDDGETPDFENKTGAVVALMVSNKLNFCSQGDVIAYFDNKPTEEGELFDGTLESLGDVNITNMQDKQILVWDEASKRWINASGGGGGGASSWDELTGKPSWIGSTKPSYQLSEINGAPSMSKMTAWDDAANKRHTHNNLTNVLQKLTVNHLNWLDFLCKYASYDSDGNITFEGLVISKKDHIVSDTGTSPGGSGSIGGGESGGEGSGGGYEDGGNTGGGSTDSGSSDGWFYGTTLQSGNMTIGSGNKFIFHRDYCRGYSQFANKVIKKVKVYISSTSSTVKIYIKDNNNIYGSSYLSFAQVSGARNTELTLPNGGLLVESGSTVVVDCEGLYYSSNYNNKNRGGMIQYSDGSTQQSMDYLPMIDFLLE